jgi:addiction module RelB/DinJ family antitoxin
MKTAILRTRIDPGRKARVDKILSQLGMTSTQAVNMLFAQIERRKAIPFPVAIGENDDTVPPVEHVASEWGRLDQEDFSGLDKRRIR